MTDGMPGWAAWGSLAEEELASEAEALLRESLRAIPGVVSLTYYEREED